MSTLKGRRTPSEGNVQYETIEENGIAVDAAGVTEIENVVGDRVKVVEVYVDAAQDDFTFNVNNNGSAAFENNQGHGGTGEEQFIPDSDAKEAAGVDTSSVEFEVTGASATADTADVSVLVETEQTIR